MKSFSERVTRKLVAWLALVALALAASMSFGACGAERLDSPPDPPEPKHSCIPPRDLAPSFFDALEAESYEGLRETVETILAACTYAGRIVPCNEPGAEPPVAGILLASLFVMLGDFAADEPELLEGVRPGQTGYCAPLGMAPADPNRLCTITRSIDRLVASREEDGSIVLVGALEHLKPLVADLLRYVDGSLPESEIDRYADLAPIRRMVRRCDDEAIVALILTTLDLIHPPRGQAILDDVRALIENEDLRDFLSSFEVEDDVGRKGVLALVDLLTGQLVRDDYHPRVLEESLEDLIYPFLASSFPDGELEADIRRVADHLVEALDPHREPEILGPLQEAVSCAMASDPDDRLANALYDLFFMAPVISLDEFLETLVALMEIDPDGAVLAAADLLIRTLADSRDASDATKQLLRVMLEEENARRIVPDTIRLLESDVLGELTALADQLVGACSGSPLR